MNIYVCVKPVPETTANIILTKSGGVDEAVVHFVLNPSDEIAVAEAVRARGQYPGAQVVALCLGKEKTGLDALRTALAMGADRAVLILAETATDSLTTAAALQAVIEAEGQAGLIFTGQRAIDAEAMQTGHRLAEGLGLPVVVGVVALAYHGATLVAEAEREAGEREVAELDLPGLIGAARGLNLPISPKLPEVLKAKRKEIKTVRLADLNIAPPAGELALVELQVVPERRAAKMLAGSPAEMAARLIHLLQTEAQVI